MTPVVDRSLALGAKRTGPDRRSPQTMPFTTEVTQATNVEKLNNEGGKNNLVHFCSLGNEIMG